MLLLDWLAGLPYLQAGIAVGLLQGYVFLLAEICHSIGFYTVEGELRSFLPARRHANLAQPQPHRLEPLSQAASPGSYAAMDLPALDHAVYEMATPLNTGINTTLVHTNTAAPAAAPRPPAPAAAAALPSGAIYRTGLAGSNGSNGGFAGGLRIVPEHAMPQPISPSHSPDAAVRVSAAPSKGVPRMQTAVPLTAAAAAGTAAAAAGDWPAAAAPASVAQDVGAGWGSPVSATKEDEEVQEVIDSPTHNWRAAGRAPGTEEQQPAATPAVAPGSIAAAAAPAAPAFDAAVLPNSAGGPELLPQVPAEQQQQPESQPEGFPTPALEVVTVDTALFGRVTSFPLDHVTPSPTHTTATALYPSGHLQYVMEQAALIEAAEEGSAGIDLGVGPLEPVEGEMDFTITNSTGSNLLPSTQSNADSTPSYGTLAATAAAASAALAKHPITTSLADGTGSNTTAATAAASTKPAVAAAPAAGIGGGSNSHGIADSDSNDTAWRSDTAYDQQQQPLSFKPKGQKDAATAATAASTAAAADGPMAAKPAADDVKLGLPAQRHLITSVSRRLSGSSSINGSNGSSQHGSAGASPKVAQQEQQLNILAPNAPAASAAALLLAASGGSSGTGKGRHVSFGGAVTTAEPEITSAFAAHSGSSEPRAADAAAAGVGRAAGSSCFDSSSRAVPVQVPDRLDSQQSVDSDTVGGGVDMSQGLAGSSSITQKKKKKARNPFSAIKKAFEKHREERLARKASLS